MLPLLMMLPEPWPRICGRGVLHAEHHATHQRRHTRRRNLRDIEALDAAGLRRAAGIVEQAIDAAEFFYR